jgi:hypothetical protein
MKAFPLIHCVLVLASASAAEPKPVPRMQALPQPEDQISFQRDGVELARYHFGQQQNRPFVFPIIGPAGRSLTRMGHPRDPQSHSHHNSVWFAHQDVNGVNFWEDNRAGGIKHRRILRFEDGQEIAFVETENAWLDREGQPLLRELRRTSVQTLERGEWLLVIDLQLEARERDVTLGKSWFSGLGVRMAKTIGVHDGGGTIRNSEGAVDEAGCFRQPAKWVDYSGPITATATEGVTLFDHPMNFSFPTRTHVRDDGWMGGSLTGMAPRIIAAGGEPLQLRYGLYVHAGMPSEEELSARWKEFSATAWTEFANGK